MTASTLHRLLRPDPGNSTRFRHHRGNRLPARRRRGRRVVDGVADPDGAAARGGAPRRPAGAGRRPPPALVRRGRRGAERRGPRVRGPRRLPRRRRCSRPTGSARRSAALAEALRTGDADEALAVLAAGHDAVEWVDEADPAPQIRTTALAAALAVRDAAERGDVDRRAAGARPPPAPVRAPRRPLRRTPLEPAHRALAHRRDRRPALRARLRRATAPGHGQRPPARRLQRRQRRGRADARRPAGGDRRQRRPARPGAVAARRRGDDARDDDPQVAGVAGRRRHGAAARRGLPPALARALLHRRHPGPDPRARGRVGGGDPGRDRPPGAARERARRTPRGRARERASHRTSAGNLADTVSG